MLAVGYTITAYMASDDRVKRDSALGNPLGVGGGGDYFPFGGYNKQLASYAPADPDTALGYRWDSGVTFRAVRKLAGVPAVAAQRPYDPTFTKIPEFLAAQSNFINALSVPLTTGGTSPWGIKVMEPAPADMPTVEIKNVYNNANMDILIDSVQPFGSVMPYVVITYVKLKPQSIRINGTHRAAIDTVTNSIKLLDIKGPVTYDHGGYIRGWEVTVVPITKVTPRGPMGKKRGARGYSPPVGRSKRPSLLVR
jgi:hypothetical protein